MSDPGLLAWLRPELASLRAYKPHPIQPGTDRVVHLDANESPWPMPAEARAAIGERLSELALHRYPDARASRLRELVALRVPADPDEIVFGAGSDECIVMLATAMARPHAQTGHAALLAPEPSFVMFRHTALSHGLSFVGVPLDASFDLDLDATLAAIERHRPALLFFASPNNPTARLFSDDKLRRILEAAQESLVVIDEAYAPFARRTYVEWRRDYANLAIMQTLSKVGLAGIRCGWIVLPRAIADAIEKVRSPYNLSSLAQTVAELALGDLRPHLDATVTRIIDERERLAARLTAIGLAVRPSDANFLWVHVPARAAELHRHLASRGVLVRAFGSASGPAGEHVRITVGTAGENDVLLDALADWRA